LKHFRFRYLCTLYSLKSGAGKGKEKAAAKVDGKSASRQDLTDQGAAHEGSLIRSTDDEVDMQG
jgi:hypothetical protein